VGRTRGVISIRRWILIRRAWARCWPTSRIYTRWRNVPGGLASWARTCGCLREPASQPVLEKLHEYLEKIREEVLPRSEAGQAVTYALKNWTALTRYLEDGDLSIDNNHTERSLRGIAVGRRNWTFVGSDRGGKTMAVLRSFVASCELAKVDPFAWFPDVLSRIGECSIQQLDELLPHRWAAARP
jgi:transposase